jgi:hypothetical protein
MAVEKRAAFRNRALHDRDSRAHRGRRDNGAQENPECRIEHARSERDAEHIVDKGEHEVLPDITHRRAAEDPRTRNAGEVTFDFV